MKICNLFFGIKGRIDRKTYCIVLLTIALASSPPFIWAGFDVWNWSLSTLLIFCVLSLPTAWASVAAHAKRFHDINQSGKWQFVFLGIFVVSIAFIVLSYAALANPSLAIVALIGHLALLPLCAWAIWLNAKLFFVAGTETTNNYGEPESLEDWLSVNSEADFGTDLGSASAASSS